jgi:hypothetical protein
MPITLNGTTGITTPTYNGSTAAEYIVPVTGLKNRIINGAMTISQRNGTSSVTPANGEYTLDRWRFLLTQTSKLTTQQDAGAVTPPAGFIDYLGITSSSAYSIASGDAFVLQQYLEGFNVADLGWGTANAKTVTLSFWVRSSLTGTFGGAFTNSAINRSYPFSYTISAANTWEQKSVTVAGDTSGTWLKDNGIGIRLSFGLGVGTDLSGTAGAWSGSYLLSATGATSVVGTNGATWYVTGVQLEVGTQSTSFEYRQYGQELALCQRYFCSTFNIGTAPAQNIGGGMIGKGVTSSNAEPILNWVYPVSMRAAPTVTTFNPNAANNQWSAGASPRVIFNTTAFAAIDNTGNQVVNSSQSYIHASASIEL